MTKKGELTPEQKRVAAVGGTTALALSASLAILATWEGKSNTPYFDVVGVRTVCYGETRVEMRRYSDAECLVLLTKGAQQFQEAVLKVNPRLKSDPYQWAAHTSFAYNVGMATYRKSSVARLYAQGREVEACQFIVKYKYAGRKVFRGLLLRRQGDHRLGERELCLTPHSGLGKI